APDGQGDARVHQHGQDDRQGFRGRARQSEKARRDLSSIGKPRDSQARTTEQKMQVNPYLSYNGNCEAAFKYYEKQLGAKIEMLMRYEDGPPDMPSRPEHKKLVMHARMSLDGATVMASDAPPDRFHKPQGFSLSLTVNDPTEAERKFKSLSDGGNVDMAF